MICKQVLLFTEAGEFFFFPFLRSFSFPFPFAAEIRNGRSVLSFRFTTGKVWYYHYYYY